MKQIKTIYKKSPSEFDENVNKALQDGWKLTRRTFDDGGFIAELERDVVTEKEITDAIERCCETCNHFTKSSREEPCLHCSDDGDKWEAVK